MDPYRSLPFTEMGAMVDGIAVTACLTSGMIVIVDVDRHGAISGIFGAYTMRAEAWEAWQEMQACEGYAVIIPTEAGPHMYYGAITNEEFDGICGL